MAYVLMATTLKSISEGRQLFGDPHTDRHRHSHLPGHSRRLVRENGNQTWTDENGPPATNPNDAPKD